MDVGEIQELPASGCFIRRWAVQGRARNPYTVSTKTDGTHGCSCPDWAKHFPRQGCKHIMKVKLEVLVPVPAAAPAAFIPKTEGRKFR